MESHSVGPRIVVEAYFGRHIEPPPILTLFKNIIIVVELRVAHSQLHSHVWLKIGLHYTVAHGNAKGQGKHLMLLTAAHTQCLAQRNSVTREILIVSMEVEESTDGKILRKIVSTLKIHTPAAGSVRKIVSQRNIELPIDIEITVERNLRLCI